MGPGKRGIGQPEGRNEVSTEWASRKQGIGDRFRKTVEGYVRQICLITKVLFRAQ